MGKRNRVPRSVEQKEPTYLKEPEYGTWKKRGGGTLVIVTLGPAAIDTCNRGSAPSKGHCTLVETLNEQLSEDLAYGPAGDKWIKGHLLNDNLGGPGISQNLTPLTHTANRNHASLEGKIKSLLQWAHREGAKKEQAYWYGLEYRVRPGEDDLDTSGVTNTKRFKGVSEGLDIKIRPVRQKKDGGQIETALNPTDPFYKEAKDRLTQNMQGVDWDRAQPQRGGFFCFQVKNKLEPRQTSGRKRSRGSTSSPGDSRGHSTRGSGSAQPPRKRQRTGGASGLRGTAGSQVPDPSELQNPRRSARLWTKRQRPEGGDGESQGGPTRKRRRRG